MISLMTLIVSVVMGQKAVISGDINGLQNAELTFRYTTKGTLKTDIVQVKDNKFVWSAEIPEEQIISIKFPKGNKSFFIGSGDMKLTGDTSSFDKLLLSGSESQKVADLYAERLIPLKQDEIALREKLMNGSQTEKSKAQSEVKNLVKKRLELQNDFISQFNDSYFCFNLVKEMSYWATSAQLSEGFDLLSQRLKSSIEGQRLQERIEMMRRGEAGNQILDFTQNDVNGKPVSISSYKGKYVFLDFWASWCTPCRAENPNLLKAYNKYKEKGFSVMGISLDDKEELWKKAIEEDKLPWAQLSDLKGPRNEIAVYYGINAIPMTLLIDPQGKIIAKGLRAEALDKKLVELFGY